MNRVYSMLWTFGIMICLGIGMVGLLNPRPAAAGDVHLSIGFGITFPIEVVPAPVIVAPPPVIVYPAPVITYPAPVVVAEPYIVHPYHRHLPPGLAKKYYGHGDYAWHRHKSRKHKHHDD